MILWRGCRHEALCLRKIALTEYLDTVMIDGWRVKRGPLDLSITINGAKPELICLPPKLGADLDSAPQLCFQNISRREERRRKKNEPVFTRTFLDRCIFNSLQADEGCWKYCKCLEGGAWTAVDIRPWEKTHGPPGAWLQMTRLHDLESTSATSV